MSSSQAHQRDRTALFDTPSRIESPYDKGSNSARNLKYDESIMASLESQNDDEINSISSKVSMLKKLGVKMGNEINKSMNMNNDLIDNFDRSKLTVQHTFKRMIVMSENAGIGWRTWLAFFFVVFLFFFWVWLF